MLLALGELARRQNDEKCRYFVPNGGQESYIRAVGECRKRIFLLVAANGVGKDCVAMNIAANIFWGPQNEWFDYPLFRTWPFPEKHIRLVTESKLVDESGPTDKEIGTWWPKGRYSPDKGGKTYISKYRTDTGFLLDKMTYQQDPAEFEGVNLGGVWFSEPPPKEIFQRCLARLRRGGIILIYMTPLNSAAWIQDELIGADDVEVVTADIEANCRQHGVRGQLDHTNIEWMMSRWDPDEFEARAHGRFMHLSNVILGRSFNRQYHLAPDDLTAPEGAQWFTVVDPARGKPWAIAVGWVDLRGQIVIDEEYPKADWLRCKESNATLRDYADIVKIMEKGKNVEWRIIDRHFANARNDYGTTLKQDFAEKFGLEFRDSYACEEEVETGIQKVKDMLKFNDRMPLDSLNFPRLRVKHRCANIIRALERWDRDPNTLRPKADSPYKDHFDLVRYACMANLEVYVPRPARQDRTIYALGRGA